MRIEATFIRKYSLRFMSRFLYILSDYKLSREYGYGRNINVRAILFDGCTMQLHFKNLLRIYLALAQSFIH